MVPSTQSLMPVIYPQNNTDLYGYQRYAEKYTLFDSKQTKSSEPHFWQDLEISGSGTSVAHSTFRAGTLCSLSNLTAGKRARQTWRRFAAQSSKNIQVIQYMRPGVGAAGIRLMWGPFTGNDPFFDNGPFWRLNGATLQVGIISRATTSEKFVSQLGFNIDSLSNSVGINPSKFNLDLSMVNAFVTEYQWIGGVVRFGVIVGGRIIYCHQFDNINLESEVFMSTPNLPIRVEFENDATGPAYSFLQGGTVVNVDGKIQETGLSYSVNRGSTPLITLADADLYPLLAIRLKAGFSEANVDIKSLSALVTTMTPYRWELLLNPTVTGTQFNTVGWVSVSEAVEACVATTSASKVSGGTKRESGYVKSENEFEVKVNFPNKISLGSTMGNSPTSDILVVAVGNTAAVPIAESFYGSISFVE